MQLSIRPTRHLLFGAALLWSVSANFSATPAAAQIVRVRPGMGIHVNTPYTNIHIAPRFEGRPKYEVPPVNSRLRQRGWRWRRNLGRARVPGQPARSDIALEPKPKPDRNQRQAEDTESPTAASSFDESPAPTTAASSDMPEPARPLPTETDLANLDDATLSVALADISNRLDARLARYKTGAGWQRYLQLPEEILASPGFSSPEDQKTLPIKREAFRETLTRFEQVANNADFRIIARQPSFVASLAALREIATRLDHGNTVTPTASTAANNNQQEVLPTPAPARRQVAPTGEHSILKR